MVPFSAVIMVNGMCIEWPLLETSDQPVVAGRGMEGSIVCRAELILEAKEHNTKSPSSRRKNSLQMLLEAEDENGAKVRHLISHDLIPSLNHQTLSNLRSGALQQICYGRQRRQMCSCECTKL